jgi:4-hydroxy-tetrahydrodipicolinate synthase
MKGVNGTITACITPFNAEGVDYVGLRENLEQQISQNIDAILVLGTTGETPTLTHEERVKIIKIAVAVGKGKTAVWVGTGTSSTETTIANTLEAEELGADVALVVTPYYNCPTQEGLYQHMRAVHDQTNIPICLYNVPKRTGTMIETPTVLRLAELSRIVAVKDATGNLSQLQELISIFGNDHPLTILSGDDVLTVPMIAMGAQGLVSVASNLIPAAIVRLVNAARNDDITEARNQHYSLLPLFKTLSIEANPIPIKAAMTLWEMPAGPCRLPLSEIEEDNLRTLSSILQRYEHLHPTTRRTS